jgi:hypothetical protein
LLNGPDMMKGLAVLAVLLCGCDLYFGGGGGDDVCYATGAVPPNSSLRDPNTGLCQPANPGCDGTCGPCDYAGVGIAQPDWGACYSQCDGLDEQTCFVTPGCYAAYRTAEFDASGNDKAFWGCWQTAPSGPVQGQCANLDAHACSRHDDCIAIYEGLGPSQFLQCQPEPATYCLDDTACGPDAFCDHSVCYPSPTCPSCPNCGACPDSNVCYGVCVPKDPRACDVIDCGPGYHCEEQCYSNDPTMGGCAPVCVQDQTCASVDCAPGYTCAQVCTTDANGQVTCGPTCVPDANDLGQCYGTLVCAMPAPACPQGTTPGIKNGCYTGYCIPTAQCGPSNPGECYGAVTCNVQPPQCPTGTVPGVLSGCYTGYCIPQSQCPLPACETLTNESACVSRMDCVPVYDGDQCTCYPDHCECQILTYSRCEAL